jgi:hypothetical protein
MEWYEVSSISRLIALLLAFFIFIPQIALASDYSASDAGKDMVTGGIEGAFISAANNMWGAFENNTAVNEEFGTTRGALFTFITHIPDPYSIPEIKNLYTSYFNLALYFVVLFILGEFINRNLARAKITESVFGEKDLSTSKFVGGIAMCFIGLFANLIFIGALKITEALSQYAMFQVMDSIAPDPSNFVTYLGMAFCDLCVAIFFIIRYFVIIATAVCCTVLAVLLVPESTRGFAKRTIGNVIRILSLQPGTIFATSIGIIGLKHLPYGLQQLGYIGLTIFVALVCWYLLTGDFEFIKKGGKALVKVIAV